MITETSYMFVTHTNSYSLTLHKDFTAFCTGIVGECGSGQALADRFFIDLNKAGGGEESPFLGKVKLLPDQLGIHRASTQWKSNDDIDGAAMYASIGICFCEEPTASEQRTLVERAKLFSGLYNSIGVKGGGLKIEGHEIVKVQTTTESVPLLLQGGSSYTSAAGCVKVNESDTSHAE